MFRISQTYADSANVSEFRKFMRIPLTICGFRLQFAESTYNLQIPLKIRGSHLQLWIPRQLKFPKHIYYYLFMYSTNWFRIPHVLLWIQKICLFLEQFYATQCFSCLSVESKTGETAKEK